MRSLFSLILVLVASATIAAGPRSDANTNETISLTFGLYQSDKATVMYRTFTPVLEALQADMEAVSGRSVDIELRIFKTYAEAQDALVDGEVDFVRFGPASYVLANQRNPDIELVAMESKKGEKRFKGVVVVPANSPIKSLEQLEGCSFAFGDRASTIGRYLVQAELVTAGIEHDDLSNFDYLGRHDTVFRAVEMGDFDAGSLKSGTFKKLNTDNQLRVLHSFDNVTKPWIARSGMAADVLTALRSALLNMSNEDALAALKVSGFLPSTDEDFAFVREGMVTAMDFGPLDASEQPVRAALVGDGSN